MLWYVWWCMLYTKINISLAHSVVMENEKIYIHHSTLITVNLKKLEDTTRKWSCCEVVSPKRQTGRKTDGPTDIRSMRQTHTQPEFGCLFLSGLIEVNDFTEWGELHVVTVWHPPSEDQSVHLVWLPAWFPFCHSFCLLHLTFNSDSTLPLVLWGNCIDSHSSRSWCF